ncbi:MAG TPA: hypothetical protein VNN22_09615 [Verrucomicrobiae bacterium]|nr:hypothetical protein [Verrucomicrobiae bacterium]
MPPETSPHKLPAPSVPHPKQQQQNRNRIPFSKPGANRSNRSFIGDLEYFKSEGGMSLLFFYQRGQNNQHAVAQFNPSPSHLHPARLIHPVRSGRA